MGTCAYALGNSETLIGKEIKLGVEIAQDATDCFEAERATEEIEDAEEATETSVIFEDLEEIAQKAIAELKKGALRGKDDSVLKKCAEATAFYGLTKERLSEYNLLSKVGYDFEKLIDVYTFLAKIRENKSMVIAIYNEAKKDADNKFWLENAYERYIAKAYVL